MTSSQRTSGLPISTWGIPPQRNDTDLAAVALEPWALHVWHHDPRFAEFLPTGDATVYEIAASGTALERRALWDRLDALRDAVEAQGVLSLTDAVSEYVEAISGQHGQRLQVLLAVTDLNGHDPVTRTEAARRLNVSRARIYQIVQQMDRQLVRARPDRGPWMPQVETADREGWPEDISSTARSAMRALVAMDGT